MHVTAYLDPPEHAIVLCVDEKSHVQGLERTQPVLPMRSGQVEKNTWDYVRHGTTTLFAALDPASGHVIGSLHRRHRTQEILKFLKKIDVEVADHFDVHLVLDNYKTHKTEAVNRWLLRHPRFQLHIIPTCSSWLNLVERGFAELTRKKLQCSSHLSVQRVERDRRAWMEISNEEVDGKAVYDLEGRCEGGLLTFGGYEPGRYKIWLDTPSHAPLTLGTRFLGRGLTDLGRAALLKGASVRVRVLVPDGQSPPRLTLLASYAGPPAYVRSMDGRGESVVMLGGLGPGRCTFSVGGIMEAPGAASQEEILDVAGDEVIERTIDLR